MSPEERWSVPVGWAWVSAADIATIVGGGTPSTRDSSNFAEPGAGIPWLTPADLSSYHAAHIERGTRDLTESGLSGSGARLLPAGTVLFTSRAPIGYCVVASNPIATNQGFKSFVLADGVVPEFVRHYLLASRGYAESLASGSTFKELSGSRTEQLSVPVAPTNEQRRIVAKIEALLARSARAREALDAIPTLLDRYRQSVLAAAFRGDLTADWREQNPDVEPASELLERIRADHRDRWDAGTRRGSYKGLSAAEPQKSEDLPASWCVVSGAHLLQWGSGKNLPSKEFQEGTVPVYGGNGISGYHSEALIDHATIVIGRVGALCGNVYSSTGPSWVTDNAIYASYIPSLINLDFIKGAFQIANLNTVATGSGQPFVNQAILNATTLPLPPLIEQDEICRLLSDAFASMQTVERAWKAASDYLPKLNQSILAKAFRGELVPQDPNDEPASALLARIKAERAAKPHQRVRGRRRKAQEESDDMPLFPGSSSDKPLADILNSNNGSMKAESLWQASGLSIDDFYKQLKREVEGGLIREDKNKQLLLTSP